LLSEKKKKNYREKPELWHNVPKLDVISTFLSEGDEKIARF
jgi:hypothetical protein